MLPSGFASILMQDAPTFNGNLQLTFNLISVIFWQGRDTSKIDPNMFPWHFLTGVYGYANHTFPFPLSMFDQAWTLEANVSVFPSAWKRATF